MSKSKKMLAVEKEYGIPLEELLPFLINSIGVTATCSQIKVKRSTLYYWLLLFKIEMQKVAVCEGERVLLESTARNGKKVTRPLPV